MGNSQLIEFTVSGNSMSPILNDGQKIHVDPTAEIDIGDIIVATHPIQTDLTIVKKVVQILSDESFRVVGINRKESSHNFGPVKSNFVIGKVLMNLDV